MTGDSEKVAWPQRKEQGSRIPKLQWERRWAAEPAGPTLTPQKALAGGLGTDAVVTCRERGFPLQGQRC